MKKTFITIGLATLLTIGLVSASGFLSPGGGTVSYNYTYISSANSTTTINPGGPGILGMITLDTPASGTVITAFDGTVASNTVIAKITLPGIATMAPATLIFGIRYQTGLTVQETGATTTLTVSSQ